jgi:hypothetical protein
MLAGLLVALFPTAMAPAQAALSGTPGVYIASGHDLDLHCGSTDPSDSEYSTYCGELNILVHNATTVAVPNVLALGDGSGTCFENSMSNLPDTTVEYLDISADPSVYAAKNFSAYDVIVLSSSYCSSNEFPTSVNTRTADFISYYNAGGGIIQMTNGGGGWSPEWDNDYYLAVGFHAASVEQTDPRTVTADGEAWGLTDEMVNCCATHNSFLNPPSTFTALEYDSTGIPERALAAYAGGALRLSVTNPECGLTWNTLAGIGWVESHHGTIFDGYITDDGSMSEAVYGITLDGDNGTIAMPDFDDGNFDLDPNGDRAVGPMQIIPPTWAAWHVDGNLDGVEDGQSIDDSVLVSSGYLCYNSDTMTNRTGWNQSIRAYNDVPIYAIDVAAKADEYERATACTIFC